jgi:hypothetical protein
MSVLINASILNFVPFDGKVGLSPWRRMPKINA